MLSQTGADKVHLVGHSLGGVVIAQAIAGGRLTGRVDTVVTLASPFGGSPSAKPAAVRADCPGVAHRTPSGTGAEASRRKNGEPSRGRGKPRPATRRPRSSP